MANMLISFEVLSFLGVLGLQLVAAEVVAAIDLSDDVAS